jgi:hypothetical protein
VDLEGNLVIHGTLTMDDPAGELHTGGNVTWGNGAYENISAGNIYFSGDWTFGNSTNQHLSGTNTATADGDSIQNIYFSGNDAAFNDLALVKPSSHLIISHVPNDTLTVARNLVVGPDNMLRIHQNTCLAVDSAIHVETGGILTSESNSTLMAHHSLQLDGELILYSQPKVYCHKTFLQGTTGYLEINGGSFILDEPYSGTLHAFAGTTDLNGGTFEITNNGFQLGNGAVFNFNGGSMRLGWGFKAIYPGSFQPSQGTVEMMGNRAGSIEIHPDNYFYNLLLNKGTYTVFGMDSIWVTNDLTINSGSLVMIGNRLSIGNDLIINPSGNLDPGDGIVRISGDWFNNRGAAGFTQGLSTVIFQGVKNSTLSNSETFYNLRLNKPVSFTEDLFLSAGTTADILNRFDILDGVAHLDDNTILNVTGNLFIAGGGGLDAGYGTPVNINLYGFWTDENTSFSVNQGFNPGTSTVSFLGGEEIYYYSGGTGNFYDLVINKTTDAFLAESNFLVQRDFDFIAGDFDNAEPGLTYDFQRDFTIHSGATWYDSTSTIRFSGSGRQSFVDESTASLKFKDIVVEMTSVADSEPFVILYNDLRCYDDLDILEGDLKLNGQSLECGHQLNILTGGKLSALDNSTIKMGDGGQVNLSGGTLDLIGTSPGYSTVTRQSTGYYSFTLNALSTLNASRTIFEFMDANGINILNNSTIGTGHQFNDCIFRKGITGGTLMTVSSKQTLTIYNASFPANSWGGAYNVAKTNNINSVTFINESGGFAGDSYENDPNDKIFWSLSGRWTGLVSHDWHTGGNWYYNSVPDAATVVYIPPSAPFMPWVQTDGFCKSLTLDESAFLKLLNANLTISTYADILGELDVDSSAVLTLDSLNFKPGSTGRADWRGYIKVIGDLTIHEGADVHLDEGILYFINSKNSTFTNQADSAFIWALINQKPTAFWLSYGGGSTGSLVVQNNFTNNPGSKFIADSPEGIVFQGRFRNNGGIIRANDGTITLAGDPYYALRTGDGSYFNGLTLKTTTHLMLDNNYPDSLVVNGVLRIEPNMAGSSGLEARVNTALPAMPIILKGDWVNDAGTGAFVHGYGRVEFLRASGDQNIFGNTSFYDVADSTQSTFRLKFFNSNSILHNLNIKHRVAVCDTLMVYGTVDLNRSDAYLFLEENGYLETEVLDQGGHMVGNSGFFMNYDLAENEITGDYQLNGASINITQLESKTIDLNGSITINSGEMWIYGGSGASKWPSNTGTASLTMSGGILGVYNGIYLNNDNFTENISGGTIRTSGNFTIYDEVSTFHPIGGTVELTGNTNSTVSMFPAGCWFHNLKISKGSGFQVTPEDYVNIKGELRISSGTFKTSGQTVQVGD